MSKERLEVYKKMPPFAVDEKGFSLITEEQYCWLFDYAVEQAERVQNFHEAMKRQDKVIDDFRKQNKRYREAIEKVLYETGDKVIQNILETALEEC